MSLAHLAARTLVLLALVSAAPAVGAETASPPSACATTRGALALASCHIAEQLGAAARGADVTVVSLKSDATLPAPDQLRQRVQAGLESTLQSAERAKGRRSKLAVELAIEKVGGVLRLTADLRRATGLWQRLRHERTRAEQHAFVEVALDAELRSLIPPPPLVVSEVLKLKAPERGIVALACGPFGVEGGLELALVSRSHVRVGRIVRRAFAERQKAAWSTLSPVAPVPLREPLASAEFTPQGRLRVALSDRRDSLELGADLSVRSRTPRTFPAVGGLDAWAELEGLKLGRDAASAELVTIPPGGAAPKLHVGAQLALGDADNDGNPELAYSADTLDAAKDRLTLVTLQGSQASPRFELPAFGISAVAICSRREGASMAQLVLASGDELWLIR